MIHALRFAALIGILALFAPAVRAQTDDERARARVEFERGVAAYETRDYQRALDAFQEAYRLAPHASVRLNIANCYQQMNRPVEALFHFEHYLTEASSVTAAQRREIEASIRDLRRQTGTITLQVTPDGATIVIDGGDTRRAPVSEPVRVTAGDHNLVITLDGFVTERQTVHVEGGGDARVAIRLRRADTVASGGTGGSTGTGSTGTGSTGTGTSGTGTSGTGTGTGTSGTGTSGTGTSGTGTSGTGSAGALATSGGGTGASGSGGVSGEGSGSAVASGAGSGGGSGDGGGGEATDGGGGIRLTAPVFIAGGITLAAGIAWAITGGIALAENGAFEDAVVRANDTTLSDAARNEARVSGRSHADTARTLAITSDVLMVTTLVGLGATTFFFILAQTEDDSSESAALDPSVLVVPVVSASPDGSLLLGATAAGRF